MKDDAIIPGELLNVERSSSLRETPLWYKGLDDDG